MDPGAGLPAAPHPPTAPRTLAALVSDTHVWCPHAKCLTCCTKDRGRTHMKYLTYYILIFTRNVNDGSIVKN